jgi:hypothetical protein
MDTSSITNFFTPNSINQFQDLIMSGAIVMMVTQGTKGIVDSIFNKIKFIKTPSTSGYVGFLSFVQAIFFMFVFNNYEKNLSNMYLVVVNACLLYFGCTKSFDFVFQKINFGGKENSSEVSSTASIAVPTTNEISPVTNVVENSETESDNQTVQQ